MTLSQFETAINQADWTVFPDYPARFRDSGITLDVYSIDPNYLSLPPEIAEKTTCDMRIDVHLPEDHSDQNIEPFTEATVFLWADADGKQPYFSATLNRFGFAYFHDIPRKSPLVLKLETPSQHCECSSALPKWAQLPTQAAATKMPSMAAADEMPGTDVDSLAFSLPSLHLKVLLENIDGKARLTVYGDEPSLEGKKIYVRWLGETHEKTTQLNMGNFRVQMDFEKTFSELVRSRPHIEVRN